MGKMTFWEAVESLRQSIIDKKKEFSRNIVLICFSITLVILSVTYLTSSAVTITLLICAIITGAFFFLAVILVFHLFKISRCIRQDSRIHRDLIAYPDESSEEDIYNRFYLSSIAGTIASSVPDSYDLQIITHREGKNDITSSVKKYTELMFWNYLATNDPDTHSISLKNGHYYVIHINPDQTATFTIIRNNYYTQFIIALDENYLSHALAAISAKESENYNNSTRIDWNDPESVHAFYAAAFPEHHLFSAK